MAWRRNARQSLDPRRGCQGNSKIHGCFIDFRPRAGTCVRRSLGVNHIAECRDPGIGVQVCVLCVRIRCTCAADRQYGRGCNEWYVSVSGESVSWKVDVAFVLVLGVGRVGSPRTLGPDVPRAQPHDRDGGLGLGLELGWWVSFLGE